MIDKIRKIIWIIVGALTILSLVFALAKKVGLAASSVSDYPLPYGLNSGYGFTPEQANILNSLDFNFILSKVVQDGLPSDVDTLILREVSSSSVSLGVCKSSGLAVRNFDTFQNSAIDWYYGYSITINPNNPTSIQYNGGGSFITWTITFNSFISDNALPSDTFITNYPIYSTNDLLFNDNLVFTSSVSPPIPSGHSKAGVIVNYEDSIDQIEDNSSLPSVDVTPPSDPSNNASWFQKILNGLKTINQNLKAGVVTIGDYIGQGIQDLKDHIESMTSNIQQSIQLFIDNFNEKFSNLREWIQGVKDKVEEIADYLKDAFSLPTSEQVAELLNQFLVGTTFGQFLGISNQAVQIIGSVFGQNIPEFETLVFTFNIDFFGQTFPLVLDFGFYTSSVRNTVVGVFLTFFYIGFLIHIIHQLPSIISGSSGVEKDISPIVKDQVKHTRWNMGLHN